MPTPISVRMQPYDPAWGLAAERETSALRAALGSALIVVHHIGSTSIPGMPAKPVLDLLPVVLNLNALDDRRPQVEQLGYEWWGEYGLASRRYCTKSDPSTGSRLVQLHCWTENSPEIERHLAFRDFLRGNREVAAAYATEKMRCQILHPGDSHAYNDCRNPWIRTIEVDALAAWRPTS